MNNISAIIVAKDNPIHIFKSINSIASLVSEIIIVDIGLKDVTVEKLNKIKLVKVIQINENIPYVEVIREDSKEYASNDIILFLDPDEIVSPDLADLIEKNYQSYDYISIPRKNIIFGKWISHSRWWPDLQTRVFKKNKVSWPKMIHAQPKLHGKGLYINASVKLALIHYNYENISEYLEKMMRYAQSDAKSRTTYSLHKGLQDGIQEFISRFFAGNGYKDGMHGFVLAFLQLLYYPLVYFYYWENKKYQNINEDSLIKETSFFTNTLFNNVKHWLIEKKFLNSASQLKYKIIKQLLK